jgi:hypothetical protein
MPYQYFGRDSLPVKEMQSRQRKWSQKKSRNSWHHEHHNCCEVSEVAKCVHDLGVETNVAACAGQLHRGALMFFKKVEARCSNVSALSLAPTSDGISSTSLSF